MSVRWIALYTAEDTHPRLFDDLDRALQFLQKQERLPEEVLDAFALNMMVRGVAAAEPPEVRRTYRLGYVDKL